MTQTKEKETHKEPLAHPEAVEEVKPIDLQAELDKLAEVYKGQKKALRQQAKAQGVGVQNEAEVRIAQNLASALTTELRKALPGRQLNGYTLRLSIKGEVETYVAKVRTVRAKVEKPATKA